MIVTKHTTIKKAGETAKYKVQFKSGDKKSTLTLEIPDLGRQALQNWPENTVLEMVLQAPSQVALDNFLEAQDEKEEE